MDIKVFKSEVPTCTVVYCNCYGEREETLLEMCKELGCKPFHLVTISGLEWDADLSPWPAEGSLVTKRDDFRGLAGNHLQRMLEEVMPKAEEEIFGAGKGPMAGRRDTGEPIRILAGYSMGGLFALYAVTLTDAFAGIVSASGSVWFPGFEEYAITHGPMGRPAIYLSIGDREKISRKPLLTRTEDIDRRLAAHYAGLGLASTFELNPGNHFIDAELRLAKGIAWAVSQGSAAPGSDRERSTSGIAEPLSPILTHFIESEIIPRYAGFDKAHQEDHAQTVIRRAMELAEHYPVKKDIVYVAAACHDLGLAVDRKTHHLESGRIIRGIEELRRWFGPEEIEIIAEAAEDHRASSDHEPRSIYGRIVAEADRLIVPESIIRRTIQYGLAHYPELDREGHWQRTLEHLHEKYYYGGYLKLWIPESPNHAALEQLRRIISDEKALREIFERMFGEETGSANAGSII